MGFYVARGLTAHLISFALILQSIEIFKMLKFPETLLIWSAKTIGDELESSLPFGFGHWLKSDHSVRQLALAQFIVAIGSFLFPVWPMLVLLLVIHLLLCVRFRGSVNGGSDAMTAIVLTGLIFSTVIHRDALAQAGLLYVAIHVLYSYLKSGVSKVRQREWREGRALSGFLRQSLFNDIREVGLWLQNCPTLSLTLCWLTMLFEILVAAVVIAPLSIGLILSVVIFFHLLIYLTFGLNRFFWVWISAWPTVFFAAHQVQTKIVF